MMSRTVSVAGLGGTGYGTLNHCTFLPAVVYSKSISFCVTRMLPGVSGAAAELSTANSDAATSVPARGTRARTDPLVADIMRGSYLRMSPVVQGVDEASKLGRHGRPTCPEVGPPQIPRRSQQTERRLRVTCSPAPEIAGEACPPPTPPSRSRGHPRRQAQKVRPTQGRGAEDVQTSQRDP